MAADATLTLADDALERAIEHVRANAARYMGVDAPVTVRVRSEVRRPRASLVWVELTAGSGRLRLIIKQTSLPRAPEAGTDPTERPRLVIRQDYEERHRFEYFGLVAAQEHFTRLGDPRFGAVRPFDHLPEFHAFVVEQVADPTLRDRLSAPGRFTPAGRRTLERGFRNAGAWLREFQALPSPEPGPPLRPSAADVAAAIEELAGFLSRATSNAADFGAVARDARRAIAGGAIADPLALGLSHGDFAPRNVFATAGGRVAGFDMAARRRVPALEDVAYFCVALRAGTARLTARALDPRPPRLDRHARQFLEGYFGDEPVPHRALATFMLLATLDNWSRIAAEPPPTGLAQRAARAGAARTLARDVSHLVGLLR